MLDFFEALIRDGAGEKYFENPAALLFVIAPLLRTVKRISEVTYLQQIIIDSRSISSLPNSVKSTIKSSVKSIRVSILSQQTKASHAII